LFFFRREKNQPGSVAALRRQFEAGIGRDIPKKRMRHLNQDTGAIAGRGITAAGATVRQIRQNPEGVPDDVMGRMSLDVADHADTAGVVLKLRVIQSFRRSRAADGIPSNGF
jgi:hypothetical protein